jgi:hypothetical protein
MPCRICIAPQGFVPNQAFSRAPAKQALTESLTRHRNDKFFASERLAAPVPYVKVLAQLVRMSVQAQRIPVFDFRSERV